VKKAIVMPALILLAFLLAACSQTRTVPAVTTAVSQRPTVAAQAATATPVWPTVAASKMASATVPTTTETTATATPLPTLIPSPTADPYVSLSVEALAARSYGGGDLTIVETLERNEKFARYLIRYPSDGLSITGFMNVPNEGTKFPVAIVLHGYIPPAEYETLAYSVRYADALAEAGYFVIHPNLRNYPPSDSGSDLFRTGMAIDALNLIAIIQEQSLDPLGPLRRAAADDINLWGHSMGGGVALRVVTVNNDEAIKTAVLYGAMSGDEELNYGRILEWSGGRRGDFELTGSQDALEAISPINYLERIEAAISIHHSDGDDVVPLEWSLDLCRRLEEIGKQVECHTYSGAPHTFNGVWDEVFTERFIRFFDRY
jgi:dienelactone hydrolase